MALTPSLKIFSVNLSHLMHNKDISSPSECIRYSCTTLYIRYALLCTEARQVTLAGVKIERFED